jgi:hypothetical protein
MVMYSGMLTHRLRDWLIDNNRILSKFQAGFMMNKRTTVIKIKIDTYLKVKRGRINWSMVDLEKAFDSIHRGAVYNTQYTI